MRLIDAEPLYNQTAEWEAQALAEIEKLNSVPLEEMDYFQKKEWYKWSAVLNERSAFKHDVADAPTVDAVQVVRCRNCLHGKSLGDVGTWCNRHEDLWPNAGYCSKAERRPNG